MEFVIKIVPEFKRSQCELLCNEQDYNYVKELLHCLQKHDVSMMVYDDEHNMYIMPLVHIYYIECVDTKTFVYTKNTSFRSYQNFSSLKKHFHQFGFRQINRNTIVNIHYIVSINIVADSRRMILLENDEHLIVNRNFRNFLNQT